MRGGLSERTEKFRPPIAEGSRLSPRHDKSILVRGLSREGQSDWLRSSRSRQVPANRVASIAIRKSLRSTQERVVGLIGTVRRIVSKNKPRAPLATRGVSLNERQTSLLLFEGCFATTI